MGVAKKKQETARRPNVWLRQAREQCGWTQEELAERVGVSVLTVGRWERGEAHPGVYFRRLLCDTFQQSAEALGLAEAPQPVSQSAQSATLGSDFLVSGSREPLFFGAPVAAAPVCGLIGRADDLRQVKRLLAQATFPTSLALTGLPGVGKTTLATALAHDAEIRALFPDGVLWAGLGPTPDTLSLLGAWGAALGMSADTLARATTIEALGRAIRATIGARRLLLVIDDAWRLEDALTLVIGGPHCAHLVTSRFPALGWQFAPYGAYQVRELDEDAGATLLRTLAPNAITCNDAGEAEARELARAVGGLPLALTLMGAYLHIQAQSGQPRRLSAALASLRQAEKRLRLARPYAPVETPPGMAVGAAQSLQVALAMSAAALTPAARRALSALAYLPAKPNSFTEEAALALSAATHETLDELVDAGLLESVGAGRYTLHQTAHDYAQVVGEDETSTDVASVSAAVARRAALYYVAYTEAHEHEYALLEPEADNIALAIQSARRQGMALAAARGGIAFAGYLEARGRYAVAEDSLNAALRSLTSISEQDENTSDSFEIAMLHARAELGLARLALRYGRHTAATAACQRGLAHIEQFDHLELSEEANDERARRRESLISSFYVCQGEAAMSAGDHTLAEESLKLALAHAHRDARRLGEIYRLLGEVSDSMGRYPQGDALYRLGLTWAHRAHDSETICMLLQNMGGKAIMRGEYAAGEALLHEGLALARAHGLRQRMSALLNNLGASAMSQGRMDDAERLFLESLELARAIGHPTRMILALENLTELMGEQAEFACASDYARECLRLAREIDQPFLIGDSLCAMGALRLKQARAAWYDNPQALQRLAPLFAEARACLEEAREIGEIIGGHKLAVNATYKLARIAAAQGKFAEAQRYAAICRSHLNVENRTYSQEIADWLAALDSAAPALGSPDAPQSGAPLIGCAADLVLSRRIPATFSDANPLV